MCYVGITYSLRQSHETGLIQSLNLSSASSDGNPARTKVNNNKNTGY